jgi:dihydroorotase
LLAVSLDLYHNGEMSLLDTLGKITHVPAMLFNLPAGTLAKDAAADLMLFDPERGWQVKDTDLASKAKNTPFDLRLVQGVVMRTVIDGRTVFQHEEA